MDGLAALVRESLGGDPYSGVVYVFRAKRADRVKLLLWDGTGLMLVGKRLEKNAYSPLSRIGGLKASPVSQGKKIHVSCDTVVFDARFEHYQRPRLSRYNAGR
jgi:hypothetical protein